MNERNKEKMTQIECFHPWSMEHFLKISPSHAEPCEMKSHSQPEIIVSICTSGLCARSFSHLNLNDEEARKTKDTKYSNHLTLNNNIQLN